MATDTLTQDWITGEEFNKERQRLLDAGFTPASAEYRSLQERRAHRDDDLFERYGRRLIADHPDQWVAISLSGETLVRPSSAEVSRLAREQFGGGNFAIRKLNQHGAEQWRSQRAA